MKKTITIEKEVFEAVLRNSVKVADLDAKNMQLKDMLLKCREKLDELDYGCEVWQGQLTDFINEIDEVLK